MLTRIPASRLLEIQARRICIIKPSALGDVVQCLPLVSALQERFPEARISWVANRELGGLLDGFAGLNEIIPFDRRGAWGNAIRLLRTLRARQFDLVFDLQGLLRTGVMTAATGADIRVGLETAREGSHLACNCLIPQTSRDVPAHIRYWRVAEAIGIRRPPGGVQVVCSEAERYWVRDQLFGLPRPIIAVHPGARWVTKRWPSAKFAEISSRAADHFSGSVIVVGSGNEWSLGTQIVDAVKLRDRKAVNLAGCTNLKQLAAVLSAVDLVVSNDSGPMHLAAGLGTPVVGVFTCTSPVLSGPAPTSPDHLPHELVSTSMWCGGSYHKTCPHPAATHLACLQELSVERVWGAVARSLNRHRSNLRSA